MPPRASMSNPKDYTVGWICAISTEYVAAQAFLDEKHDGPEYVSSNDNNVYTLGKVGRHNVVIAVFPDGEYGTTSAVTVARDMLHSFPNIRIGLMVGIGGGAPSPTHDVRLGDIVVSAPRDGNGGVVQYDFGKTIQDQSFQTTGFLNQPPAILQIAMNGLKAHYESDGHQLEVAINDILERKARLQKKYKRPDPSNDRLYRSEITHPANDATGCAIVCGNDPSKLVLRPERSEDEDNPEIHYGLIASANQLMKNATVRDQLTAEMDILCFEMEAAGLMNHFPCLVIRGICDYSDSHKNKEWQGYAAMAAASYAKDLLCRIPPNKLEAEKRINDILSDIQEGVGKLLSVQHSQEHQAILDWLTPVEYAHQQSDFSALRQPGTGQWLLDSGEFQTWLETDKQTLFCPGIPGAGKTILTSIVVDELTTRFSNDPTIGIAYIYCNFRRQGEQKVDDLLASLLKQLAESQPSLPSTIKELYDQHKTKRTQPSLDEISRSLQVVTTLYSRVFIIVDALDECQVSDGCRQRFLSDLFKLQANCGTNIFATSRPILGIEMKFEGNSRLEIRASEEDVRRYLSSHMFRLPGFVARSLELQEEIMRGIINAADGMFLLAQLHLASLIGRRSPKAVQTVLKNLVTGSSAYDHAYRDAMERINRQSKGQEVLAKQVLSWIICAKRQLTTLELQHALAVEAGKPQIDVENLCQVELIASVCAGLVTVDKETNIIRLVHYTTQEYFERTQEHWFPDAQANITTICVTYLSFTVFESGFCQTDDEFEERLRTNPLYNYAAHNWGHHAREAQPLGRVLTDFLTSKTKVDASVQAMFADKEYSMGSDNIQKVPRNMTGLHLGAYFGVGSAVQVLLLGDHGPDLKDSYGRTPLSYAAENGHAVVVKLLLNSGKVDADSRDTSSRTPMLYAAVTGSEAVVKLLLETGKVEADSRDDLGRTPLLYAAANGYEGIVKLLLDTHKVEAHSKDNYNKTPISYAAQNGYSTIARLLEMRTLNDPGKQQNLDYEAEDDTRSSTCDQSDIDSVFTDASILSSQSSQDEQFSHAVFELAQLLLNDDELMLLYPKAISKVGSDRFQRNFARFLKSFSQSLLGEASNDLQRDAAHFIRMSARRTAAEMGRVLRQDGGELTMAQKLKLGVSKAAQVNAWLELQKRDREQQHAEIHSKVEDDRELSDESDSSGSDTFERNSLRTLDEVKEFMISAQAWLSLRQEFRAWLKLDRRDGGKNPNEKIEEVTVTSGPLDVQAGDSTQLLHDGGSPAEEISYTGTQDEHTLVGTQDGHTLVGTQDGHAFESKQSSSLNVPDSDAFEDDCMSVESNEEDIASQVATRRTEPEILAVKQFGSFFGELEELRPLHKEALKKLGAKRFQENYRKILKLYVLKLWNEAQTALEKDIVRVLKSRSNRLSIAQRIVALMQEDGDDSSKPFDELTNQPVERLSFEAWASNAYALRGGDTIEPVEEGYEHSSGGSDGEDGEYNDENEDKHRLEELHFPKITQANRFLHKGVPFQTLVLELRLLVLPASLREVIEFTPKCSIRVSPVNATSFMNKAKAFIEDYTAFEWDWWPLMPRVPDLPLGRWRLQWKFCGQHLYKEISSEEADSIEQTLGLIGDHPSKCFCCGTKAHRMDLTTIFHRTCQSIANTLNWEALSSSLAGQNSPSTAQQRYTPTAATASPSSISVRDSTQTIPPISSGSNSDSFTQAHGGGSSTMSTAPQGAPLWVVFGIKNMHEFDEIENIEISSLLNDPSFFKELKTRYNKHRWLFQRWVSPFRFRHCNFVQFEMIDVEQVYSSGEALPDDHGYTSHYEYDPRPPRAKNPLIDRKLFSICLKACDSDCSWSLLPPFLHKCHPLPHNSHRWKRIPSKKGAFSASLSQSGGVAFGIEADCALSFAILFIYHIFFIFSAFGFWIYWLKNHPDDLQNASVPTFTVLSLIGAFWGLLGRRIGVS